MPVVISLFNANDRFVCRFEGFVLNNPLMMVAGIIVGASGTLLTLLMAKAINQSVTNILLTPHHCAENNYCARLWNGGSAGQK